MENYADFSFGDERDDDEDEDEAGIEQNNKSAESEYKQYDYDFFSSLELQFMSKPVHQTGGGKNFSHGMRTRKATATRMAQRGDEWIDESKKDDSPYKFFNESESDDESDESEPEVPQNYTRGKWKPGSRPPNNFTGGKWKPEAEKMPNWDDNESSNDGNLDKSNDSNPPPSHTKGKWVPGTKIHKLEFKDDGEKDNFWCGFCSRNLATRAIYERHLKSNLHRKRTQQQNDLEEAAETLPLTNLSTHFQQTPSAAPSTSTASAEINENEIEIEVEMLDRVVATSTPLGVEMEVEVEVEVESGAEIKKKKFRSRSKVTCEECDVKLPVHLLGNHLISHFHYRKMLQNPKKSFDMVLNNFHKIIMQSPFQCHPCKFYFNSHDEFMRHWRSTGHVECVGRIRGGRKFFCSFCKFECESNEEMTDHLNGGEHQQVVVLINRSKPIVIRLLTPLSCGVCSQEFRYNIQRLHHLKTCAADSRNSKFSFGGNFTCDVCQKAFQSALSLQKHGVKAHRTSIFFCSECQQTFETADDAKLHRRTAQHKALASRKRMRGDPQLQARLRKICPICKAEKLDVLELKDHILAAHPEHNFR